METNRSHYKTCRSILKTLMCNKFGCQRTFSFLMFASAEHLINVTERSIALVTLKEFFFLLIKYNSIDKNEFC